MEDEMKDFFLLIKEVFQEDLNEFVNNDNKLVDYYLMKLLNQQIYLLQKNDHKHWKRLD